MDAGAKRRWSSDTWPPTVADPTAHPPSFDHSGLLTIWHLVQPQLHLPQPKPQQQPLESPQTPQAPPPPPLLLGFDFFREIDGKIHYMEDNCKANHHASQEERCCMDLCQEGRLGFLVRKT